MTLLSYEAYLKLVNRAIEALGSEAAANHWLNTPQPRFGNQIPLPAYNVVVHPEHQAFSSVVKLVSVEPFDFHPYLFGQRPRER